MSNVVKFRIRNGSGVPDEFTRDSVIGIEMSLDQFNVMRAIAMAEMRGTLFCHGDQCADLYEDNATEVKNKCARLGVKPELFLISNTRFPVLNYQNATALLLSIVDLPKHQFSDYRDVMLLVWEMFLRMLGYVIMHPDAWIDVEWT